MLSKGTFLNTLVFAHIFIFSFVLRPSDAVKCFGSELSIHSASDVLKITEKKCTEVFGDIVIQNIQYPVYLPSYWSIETLHGSLMIENTKDLMDSLNFQNLQQIHAGPHPALVLLRNKNLQLGIGGRLRKITSKSDLKVVMLKNGVSPIPASLLTILQDASAPHFSIAIDSFIEIPRHAQAYYMFYSFFCGIACVFLFFALIIVGLFGRAKLKMHEE